MDFRFRLVTALVVMVFFFITTGLGGATTAPEYGAKHGVAIELTHAQEQDVLKSMSDIASKVGVKPRANAFVLHSDGTRWVVFTDAKPQSGRASVDGTIIAPSNNGELQTGIIVAESVSFETTGTRVSLSDLQQNPQQYTHQLVRVTASYRQLSYLVEAQDVEYVETHTAASLGGSSRPLLQAPGDTGRWATFNLSGGEYGQSRSEEVITRLGTLQNLGVDRRGTRWWVDAEATVDLVVLETGSGLGFYIVNVSVQSKELDSVSTLHRQGDQLDGNVVTIETNALGTQTSPQETLLTSAQCAPQSVTNPVTGCLPIPADVSVHSGVLFGATPSSWDEVVVYAGLSNELQSKPASIERGRYRVTGRVVSTQRIDPRLPDGYALIVYDRERIGTLSTSAGSATDFRAEIQQRVSEQITSENQVSDTAASGSTDSTAKSSQSQQNHTPADVRIVKTSFVENPVQKGTAARIRVTLKNVGEKAGTKTLTVDADSDVSPETVKSVTVPGGTSKTVTIKLSTDVQSSVSATAVSLNGDRIGMLKLSSPEAGEPESAHTLGAVAAPLGFGFTLVSIICWLSAIVLEVLRGIKSWRGGVVQTGEKPGAVLIAVGTVTASLAAYAFDESGIAIFISGIVFGIGGFIFGIQWVYRNL